MVANKKTHQEKCDCESIRYTKGEARQDFSFLYDKAWKCSTLRRYRKTKR